MRKEVVVVCEGSCYVEENSRRGEQQGEEKRLVAFIDQASRLRTLLHSFKVNVTLHSVDQLDRHQMHRYD